jgi:hypothetical protein
VVAGGGKEMASCLFPERGWGEHVPLLALLGEKVAGEEVLGEVKRLASREDVVLEHRGRQVDVAPVVKQADCGIATRGRRRRQR